MPSPAFTQAAIDQFQAGKGSAAQQLSNGTYLSVINGVEGQRAAVMYVNQDVSYPVYKSTKLSKDEVKTELQWQSNQQQKFAKGLANPLLNFQDLILTRPKFWPDIVVVETDGTGTLLSFASLATKNVKAPIYVNSWPNGMSDQKIADFYNTQIANKEEPWLLSTGRMIPFWGAAIAIDEGTTAWKKGNYVEGLGLIAFGTAQMALEASLVYSAAGAGGRALGLGRAGATASSGSGQTFATGLEWYQNYVQRYGAQNVEWMSGSGRTITWPSQLPLPASREMVRVRPPARSSTFGPELESVAGPRPPGAIGHHNQPLGLNGVDSGLTNGSWQVNPGHQMGHNLINRQVNQLPYGTIIIIK